MFALKAFSEHKLEIQTSLWSKMFLYSPSFYTRLTTAFLLNLNSQTCAPQGWTLIHCFSLVFLLSSLYTIDKSIFYMVASSSLSKGVCVCLCVCECVFVNLQSCDTTLGCQPARIPKCFSQNPVIVQTSVFKHSSFMLCVFLPTLADSHRGSSSKRNQQIFIKLDSINDKNVWMFNVYLNRTFRQLCTTSKLPLKTPQIFLNIKQNGQLNTF